MPVITVSTTAIKVIDINLKRKIIHLENVGNHPIYFTKQNRTNVSNTPSEDNYDFVLYPVSSQGITTIEIESVSRINAIVIQGNAGIETSGVAGKLAYFQTEYITNNVC